jgi:dTMP kinase
MSGIFITFEGSESCGKSTQARMLYEYLRGQGRKAVFLREPGGTKVSEKIRKILLDKKNTAISAVTEMLLYMTSRRQTVEEVIMPALESGKIVLCDRFLDSTIVYQGYGLGLDRGMITRLGKIATMGLEPDLTILLDTPLKEALDAIGSKKDRIESRTLAYHERVKRGYLELAKREPGRIKVVKLQARKEQTQEKIRGLVAKLFERKKHASL